MLKKILVMIVVNFLTLNVATKLTGTYFVPVIHRICFVLIKNPAGTLNLKTLIDMFLKIARANLFIFNLIKQTI